MQFNLFLCRFTYIIKYSLEIMKQELYGNIHTMLEAGLSITKALRIAARGNKKHRHMLFACADDIERGLSLTDVARRHRRLFSEADVKIIEAGEISGQLVESFALLANWHLLKSQTRAIIKSGLMLPALELHIAALIWPLPAFIVGNISLLGYLTMSFLLLFFFLYLPVGTVVFICRISSKQGRFRKLLDPALLKIPILGSALENLAYARYCSAFHALHNAGIPMADCADISLDLCGNEHVASMLKGGGDKARNGYPVSEGFSDKVPHGFIELWQTGEQSGRLIEILQRLSTKQQDQAKQKFRDFGKFLPQLCMILVILIIAVLCFAR